MATARSTPDPDDPAVRAAWHASCQRRMARIDALHPDMRRLVHHYGWEPVKLLLDLGVRSPGQMEHTIRAIRLLDIGGDDRVLRPACTINHGG